MTHLNDTTTYKLLTGDPTKHICKQINTILYEYYKKYYLTKNMYTFCLPPKHARLARIYFLKKIHKNPMGIRPIVSSCESPTENISQFVDYWLQLHTKLSHSYLKDTSQFISEIEQLTIPPNATMVTIDVKSLYTNIPHNEGIKACLVAFISLERTNPQQPPAEILTNLLEIVLKNNTFEFDNKCYKQLYGTAMGTKLAPTYVNTFMGYIEDKFLSQQHLVPLYYRRFIDDIFLIWPHPINEFYKFIDKIDKIHPTIKFTHELSQETITFLDTDVHLDNNKLYVITHIKSTNKQAYTHASSYHPPGTGKGIAIGEAKRYARTNTRHADFQNCISKHIQQMKTRGYNLNHTKKLTTNIKHCDRLKTNPPRKNLNQQIFVTRYTTSAKRIIKTIRKNSHNLQADPKVGRLFPNYPIMAFRKNKNLRNYLVRAKLKSP